MRTIGGNGTKILLATVTILFILGPVELQAQKGAKPVDPAFAAFWAKFKTAIAKNDKEAVAAMTRLPFLFDSKEQTRAGFLKIYDRLFTARVKKCLASAKPLKEGDDYEVFCGKTIYLFGKVDGEYRFTEIGADD